jgi:putative transposase
VTSFAFVAAERGNHAVARLCRVVGASISGFYAWLRAIPSVQVRAEAEAELRGHVGRIFSAGRRVYGSPRIHAELHREGRRHSRRRIERLMREMGLRARQGRRRTPRTTDSRHDLPVAPNLLDRNFTAERPDAVWLADISYIPTGEGWLYLAAIEDLATREIVGWSMADHLRAGLCVDALVMALQRRRPPRGLIHHSDRGVQGGFTWSSQHRGGGVMRWQVGGARIEPYGESRGLRGGLPWRGRSIGVGSGPSSPRVCRARTRRWVLGYRSRSEPAGSERRVG